MVKIFLINIFLAVFIFPFRYKNNKFKYAYFISYFDQFSLFIYKDFMIKITMEDLLLVNK